MTPFGQQERPPPLSHRDTRRAGEAQLPVLERMCLINRDHPKETIPRSRHNPKILRIDDAEIVGDRITEVRQIPRNFFTQETERRIGELGASRVGFMVRDMLVHHAP